MNYTPSPRSAGAIPSTNLICRRLVRLSCAFALGLLAAGSASAALTVTPATIANNFNGTVDLAITGFNSAGQTVIIERYFDSDDDNSITAADQLVQRIKVTDGQVSNIGGHRNLNVPGDEDGSANLAILTRLRTTTQFTPDRMAGRFIFRISPDGAGFAPFTGNLVVTQADYGGNAISGRVMGSGSPQARAIVLFALGGSNDFDVRGAAMTNGTGNYSLKLPPGTYRPVPSKAGFVFDLDSGPSVIVGAGAITSAPDAVMTVSSRSISGTVRDAAAPNAPLPGVLVFGQSPNPGGKFAITFSDAAGSYAFPATPGEWALGLLEWPVAQLGMLQGEEFVESSAGSVTGFHLEVPRANSLIYGTLRTPANAPVPYVGIEAERDGGSGRLRASGVTDVNGNFSLGTIAGNWRVQAEIPGYLVPEINLSVPAPGNAVQVNVIASPVTAHLRGEVRNNSNITVPNIEIHAYDDQGSSSQGFTDELGRFDIGVNGGPGGTAKTWTLELNRGDEGTPLYIGGNEDFQVTDGNDINNIVFHVLGITAHLRGSLRLDGGDPPADNYQLYASAQDFSASSGSDAGNGGQFDIPVLAGNWRVGLSGQPGGVVWQNDLNLTVANGVDQNGLTFHLRTASRSIAGTVKNTGGTGIGGIRVFATITDGGVGYTASLFSNPDGSYTLPAFPGTWSVGLDSNDLNNQGYGSAASQNANTAAGNATTNFTVTASGGGSPYSNWRNSFFSPAELADQNFSGPNADPDRDGIVNLLEYAFNLRPKVAEPGSLPQVGYQPPVGPATAFLTLTFMRLTGNSGLAYNVIEAPDTTGPWTGVAASYEILSSNGTTETVRARTPIGLGKKFLRLQVVLLSP